MPMNEYGEIVRENNRNNISGNSITKSRNNQLAEHNNNHSFSSEVQRQFNVGKKRNFNIITLLVTIPLYCSIGYFTAEYIISQGYDIGITSSTGFVIGGVASLIATLLYNNIWARRYEGIEYLISLLFTGIAAAIIVLVIAAICVVVGIVMAVIQAIIAIIIAIVIIAGLAGG